MLTLRLLGGFSVTFKGKSDLRFRSDKGRALLAYLAAEPNRPHSRESLATLLWGACETTTAKTYLRTELSNLRKLLNQHPAIEVSRQTVAFKSDLASTDCILLESTISQFLAASQQDQSTLLAAAQNALEQYQGEFLAGFDLHDSTEFSNWRVVRQEQLHQFVMRGHDQIQARLIQIGRFEEAIQLAQKQLTLEAWHEPAHRRIIEILGKQDKRAQAIAQYDKLRLVLAQELGLEPERQTVELLKKIKSAEFGASQAQPSVPASGLNRFKVLANLELMPDQKLFGIDEVLGSLRDKVISADRPWLIALDGLGGIGKSTLAHTLIQQLLDGGESRFEDIAWVSAKQEEFVTGRGIQPKQNGALDADSLVDQLLFQLADGPFPTHSGMAKRIALTQIVKEKCCLIVVDNLETAADYLNLLPLMRQLAGPTKFIITSRITLHNESDVFCYSLSELSREDVFSFLRYEGRKQGIAALLASSSAQLNDIYETVGGNPLALKLIMGQVQYLPLDEVLSTLRDSEQRSVDQLYHYIYWQAWELLNENGRKLLLTLPIYPNGTFQQISEASGLDRYIVRIELNHLRSLSLVQTNGDLVKQRYRIHRLTETFLMHEIIKWQEGEDNGTLTEENFFSQKVEEGLALWQGQFTETEDQAEILRREKEGILKSIQLGLSIPEAWPLVKSLIESLTSYMERMGHWDQWLQMLDQGIDQANKLDDLDGRLMITHYRGRILQRQGNMQGVIQNYAQIIYLARRSGNEIAAARAASNLGFACAEKNQLWRAAILCFYALDIFERVGHLSGRAHTNNHLGIIFRIKEEWEKSESHFQNALTIWEQEKDDYGIHFALSGLSALYTVTGKLTEAEQKLNSALHIVQKLKDKGKEAIVLANLGYTCLQSGKFEEALDHASNAEKLFLKQSSYHGLYSVWSILGQIHDALEDTKTAHAYHSASSVGRQNIQLGKWEVPQIKTFLQ
ncbi:MAG: tetratricopeptide repeat protein [Anaerolineae bacterium]